MKKNILFIIPSFSYGGAEKVLVTILNNLDYEKYDVELLIIFNSLLFVKQIPQSVRVSVVYPKFNSFRQRIDFSLYYKFNSIYLEKRSVIRALELKSYDTIVSFLEGRALKAHSYIAGRAKRNVSWVHTDMLNNCYTTNISMRESLQKYAYSLMDYVVFVSKESMKQFDKLGYSVKNEVVIYNPIEKEVIQSYIDTNERKNEVFTIVLCGRLFAVKAYDRMIRVARKLMDDGLDFRVNLIGDGPERKNLQSLISELGVEDMVSILGFRNPPYPEMAKADLFVSTSIVEGYPVNICEAMCLGLPIVATRCTGTTEILNDGDGFSLLAEQNDESIYKCIKKMMIDYNFRRKCAKNSLVASNRFEIHRTMESIYKIFD